MTPSRIAPYSDEAERSILGCMLLDKDSVLTALNSLHEDDFYVDQNKWVFAAITALARAGSAVDSVTVWDKLNGSDNESKVGAGYLASLTEIVPFTSHIEEYCSIVREKAVLRKMINGFSALTNACFEQENPLNAIIDDAQRFVYQLSMSETRNDFVSLKEAILPAIERISELHEQGGVLTGVDTGYKDLNAITNGLQRSDLILIAARPSMGKTALGLNLAQNAALRAKKSVAFFSLEMSSEQLIMRIISSEKEISSAKIRIGSASNAEWTRITKLNAEIQENDINFYIDDTSGISTGEVRSKLRKLKATKGLDLVVIDYLQLMTTTGRIENRQQEISTISRELKALAKELDIPVVALSQLSRNPEGRNNKRPILSDLRESGAIEQDADIVMMLFRENYYDNDSDSNETEVIIAKHRNGEIGTVRLQFLSEYTKFTDAPPRQYQAQAETTH